MAGKTFFFWISIFLAVIGTNAGGEFSVLHSPNSLRFSGFSVVHESFLKEIYSAALGHSVEENVDWDGLSIIDPFNTPEAVVEVYIDGVSNLGNSIKSTNYKLKTDEYEPDMYNVVTHRIKQRRQQNGANNLVYFKLSDDNEMSNMGVFGIMHKPKVTKQSFQHLKYAVDEDYQFLSELQVLKAITAAVKTGVITSDNVVDFYEFRFSSLHALSDFHGPNSLPTKEAKKLLSEALEDFSKAFEKAYEGSVLVTVVATDVAHTRRVRAAPDQAATKANTQNEAYSQDYAAIFNIILWFGVVFVFSLIAIVYTIMDMDPGRDSIIYRMTSTRMKKDN